MAVTRAGARRGAKVTRCVAFRLSPGLISDRFKLAMAPSWADWVVTGGDAGSIGACVVVEGPTLLMAEESSVCGFDIVPNPAQGPACIRLSGAEVFSGSIFDGSGRQVRKSYAV